MEPIDQGAEARRLTKLYAELSEGELRELADQMNELSDVAQQALRTELSRRGLELQGSTAPSSSTDDVVKEGNPILNDLAFIDAGFAADLVEARKLMKILQSEGISCFLVPHKTESAERPMKTIQDGFEIRVAKCDSDRARTRLYEYFPRREPEKEKEYVVRCPQGHSTEVVFQSLDGDLPEGQVIGAKFNWRCDACGSAWKDEGIEQET